jgi:hypothetical protein
MFKERQQSALAVAEDRSGQEVLRAAEAAESLRANKERYLSFNREAVRALSGCRTEDDHSFTSYGQCSKCGAHRKPA